MTIQSSLRRKTLGLLAATPLALALSSSFAVAQENYPNRAVTIVVPFAPGGNTDVVARRLAKSLNDVWGQSVIVENKPGAGTSIGVNHVAKAKADGYTLASITGSFTVNKTLMPKLPYDTEKDLRAVAMLGQSDHVLVVNPKIKANNFEELVKLAKEKPGELTYASFGNGSSPHLNTELIKLEKGIDIIHIPYKGQGPALTDVVGGQVDMMLANLPQALPLIKDGRFKAIGLAAAERSKFAPDIPTLKEQGMDVESVSWSGIIAPAGTPDDIVNKINADVNKLLASDEVINDFDKAFMETRPMSVNEFADFLKKDADIAARVIRDAKITID